MIGMEGRILKSKRLSFRLLEDCDKLSLFRIVQEKETTIPSGFLPITDTDAFEAFWKGLTQYNTGVAILYHGGCIGYFHVNRWAPDEVEYKDKKNVGIGFLIGRNYLRQGFGTETLTTLNQYLLTQFDCIWGDYFEGNEASRKLLHKCGFIPVGTYDMIFDSLGGEKRHIYSNVLTR